MADVDYTPLVQVLDAPVPQQMDVVPSKYILVEHVEQLVPQERVQPRTDEPLHGPGHHALLLRVQQPTAEQVADLHVPLASGFGTFVEQVGVPVLQRAAAPFASVSGRVMEQVVDVPVPCVAPVFARDQQLGSSTSRYAAAWLDAPQGQVQAFFSHFSLGEKCATVASLHAVAPGQLAHGR